MSKPTNPLIILGYDAGRPDLLIEEARAGRLKVLSRLLRDGAWGKISGPELHYEHGTWLSIFSGVSRKEHGYYFFRQLEPGTYNLKRVTGRDAAAKPFWANLVGTGLTAAVVDVPDNFPVAGLPGIQICNWTTHESDSPPEALPKNLISLYHEKLGKNFQIKELHESNEKEDLKIFERLKERVRVKGELVRRAMAGNQFDLTVCLFSESHVATHQFWNYRTSENATLRQATADIYAAIDEEMQQILALAQPEPNVFLFSSTGMTDQYPCSGLIESFCRELGYKVLKPQAARPKRGIDWIRRAFPESWRIAVSRQLCSRNQREALLTDQFRNYTDWEQTTLFPIPSIYHSYLRVNLKGREPQGIVSLNEYDALLDRVEKDLNELIDPQSNEKAVQKIHRTTRVLGGAPHAVLPDLVVQWTPRNQWLREVRHPKATLRQSRPEFFRASEHTTEGFFAAAGPAIQKHGEQPTASSLDFVSEFLRLLGKPASSATQKKALFP